ncbi:MAG: methionine adenosyltransferase [Candidatus Altiarchaeota archaeon]
MRNIKIQHLDVEPVERQPTELVERKGIGHPDSICDGIAEAVSKELSQYYIKEFGHILHHNTDQVELIAGHSKPQWGGGKIMAPVHVILSGRATIEFDGADIPAGRIAKEAARDQVKATIKNADPDLDYTFDQRLGMGSSDLRDVFGRKGIPKANDTSFGCGFAPLSTVEMLCLEVEKYMNGKMNVKASGQDIKVMGLRKDDDITLTICNAMVDKFIKSKKEYPGIIEEMTDKVSDFVAKKTDKPVKVEINTGDNIKKGSVFLTVTGTSAECGDDGSVGRGNRANGLITPFRPTSLEATSGKNPYNHVGKIYNILSMLMAEDIAKNTCAEEVSIRLMSQIGHPIDKPLIASITTAGRCVDEKKTYRIADEWLARVTDVTMLCVKGKVTTF